MHQLRNQVNVTQTSATQAISNNHDVADQHTLGVPQRNENEWRLISNGVA